MTFKKILAAALISTAAFGAADAMAAGRHGGWGGGYHGGWGGGHHGHHGYYGGHYGRGYGGVGAFVGGALVAGALLSPWYYSPYYAASYPTVVEVTPPQTVYIEQAQAVAPAASDAASWWYFCNDTRAYYPYVRECASPWQRVAPSPAPVAP